MIVYSYHLTKPLLIHFVMAVLLMSCTKSPDSDPLVAALHAAGENSPELEKVLEHYASEGDSLKFAAAKWLIGNMPGHYSYSDSKCAELFYDKVDSVIKARADISPAEIRFVTDSLGLRLLDGRTTEDARIIKAEFLIRDIDEAFRQWRTGAWAKHVCFEDFCEFMLPYKVEELQPFDNWREDMKALASPDFPDIAYCDELKNITLQAAELMNAEICWTIGKELEKKEFRYPVLRLTTKLKMPSGTCRDFASLAASVMRANGIPVAVDFTPTWAGGGTGHTWCVVLAETGKTEPFSPPFTRPGDIHRLTDRVGKVYLWTYGRNPALTALNSSGEYVPELFQSTFMKDVTDEYVNGCDISIAVKEAGNRYVYLALYDNQKWVPVDFARIENSMATFRNVGPGAMYLPVCYDSAGRQSAVGTPIIALMDGTIRHLAIGTDSTQTMRLTRKYPVRQYVYEVARRIVGGEFQASNRPDFKDYVTVHTVGDCASTGHSVMLPDSLVSYRYWRYKQDRPGSLCNIAEIKFFSQSDDGSELKGTVIGTQGSFEDNPARTREAAFDGNLLTYFDAPAWDGCWVGIDFGAPVQVRRIDFVPRGDGNSIDKGDVYQLSVWDESGWMPLERKVARNFVNIDFSEVPSGGVYLLRDLTKGQEERPFTYENGQQIWW